MRKKEKELALISFYVICTLCTFVYVYLCVYLSHSHMHSQFKRNFILQLLKTTLAVLETTLSNVYIYMKQVLNN